MITVFLALFPAIFYGMYNVGNQAIPALNQLGNLDQLIANDWHYALASSLGLDLTNNATWGSKMALGAIFFLPIYLVVFTVCTIWELLFSVVRGHEVNEGMFVSTIFICVNRSTNIAIMASRTRYHLLVSWLRKKSLVV